MSYDLISGFYETGTEEQQEGFRNLFGVENTREKFKLYFHWFNLLHELGHSLVHTKGIVMDKVEEELFVNLFAVQYWRLCGAYEKLAGLSALINGVLSNIPDLLPVNADFHDYFLSIWGTEQMNTVLVYGYFQMSCVKRALTDSSTPEECFRRINIVLPEGLSFENVSDTASAQEVLDTALKNLQKLGCEVDVRLVCVDNPEIQCCYPRKDK